MADTSTRTGLQLRSTSLARPLELGEIAVYGKHDTGEKYLTTPNKELR